MNTTKAVTDAARELLRLKKLKDQLAPGMLPTFDRHCALRDYEENKPRAWAALEAALAAPGPGEGAEAVFRKVVADALNPSGGTGMFRVEYVDPATTRPQSPAQPAPAVAGENNNGR